MIHLVAETGSTNADLLARSSDWPEGDWLVALRQTGGRGRAGRQWEDGTGNFMGSTVVRLRRGDPAPQTLALVTGLAVFEAVRAFAQVPRLQLKWPNDVFVDRAKLAGILLERTGDDVVVGVGVNLARAPSLAGRATVALSEVAETVDAERFAEAVAERFAELLRRWRDGQWPALRAEWLDAAHPVGTALQIHDRDGQPIFGEFVGLDEGGAALLRLADGTVRPIHAGDVELVGGV